MRAHTAAPGVACHTSETADPLAERELRRRYTSDMSDAGLVADTALTQQTLGSTMIAPALLEVDRLGTGNAVYFHGEPDMWFGADFWNVIHL